MFVVFVIIFFCVFNVWLMRFIFKLVSNFLRFIFLGGSVCGVFILGINFCGFLKLKFFVKMFFNILCFCFLIELKWLGFGWNFGILL